MTKEKGIPKEIIEELKPTKKPPEKTKAKLIIEPHQVSIRLPAKISRELDPNKKFGCAVTMDRKGGKLKIICEVEEE